MYVRTYVDMPSCIADRIDYVLTYMHEYARVYTRACTQHMLSGLVTICPYVRMLRRAWVLTSVRMLVRVMENTCRALRNATGCMYARTCARAYERTWVPMCMRLPSLHPSPLRPKPLRVYARTYIQTLHAIFLRPHQLAFPFHVSWTYVHVRTYVRPF
jgi:hypothetical protein